ncbi:hypothetical protein PPL_02493 [Heterostelium album PN500]|uniref:C2 NT-type domain-containing protein n=1 Tax=Heterostelium pallidum (strain ATCC 26659 / Pp 5 / PN500) TaxID=670386 RepID=D3B285_HETP5|nr:hypothetical protein PPL_02493 [Heterostelium album PN500]EFA84460.1 hypothetical protein PPL_02493 [Heterostelium album PN500]|eukprot:XP_020436574.1 hypothetical protein PPL_02493 [Heterostelium album PN500]
MEKLNLPAPPRSPSPTPPSPSSSSNSQPPSPRQQQQPHQINIGGSISISNGSEHNHFQHSSKPKRSSKHLIYNENSNKPTKACVEPPHNCLQNGSSVTSTTEKDSHHHHLNSMIKGIKGGLSHARKDKIKIEYDLEFRKLLNLPNDLVGQNLTLKWSRGKKKKGETKDYKVLKPTIPTIPTIPSITLTSSEATSTLLGNSLPNTTTSNSNNNNNSTTTASSKSSSSLPTTSTSSTSSLTSPVSTSPAKQHDSFTRKQAKLLLGNKIDGSNTLASGEGYISMNEKVNLRITLYAETQIKDNNISTNFEQKLMTLSLLLKNTTLCSTTIDLSLHTEDNGKTPIDVPFPSSSSVQPSIQLAIKTNYLKYNEKKIIKTNPEVIKSKDININPPNGANKLMEIQGEVYFVGNSISVESNLAGKSSSSGSSSSSKTLDINSGSSNKDKETVSGNASDSDPHTETITRSTSWDDESEDTFQLSTKEALAKKNVELNEMSEKLNKYESQIKQLECQIEQKNTDILSLRHVIDENQAQVLIYEENVHRYKVLEERATKQLIRERHEFAQFKNAAGSGSQSSSNASSEQQTSTLDIRDFEKELEIANQHNETLKEKLEEMEAEYAEEKKKLLESNDTMQLLYEDTKEKLKALRVTLDGEMKTNNSKLLQESELRKRITQQIEVENTAKLSTMSTQRKIFNNPYIAWAIAFICLIMLDLLSNSLFLIECGERVCTDKNIRSNGVK